MEGICGRMCDACTWKEQLDCPGCQDGPGRRFSGGCPIADCCREKGHTACVTCTFSTGCALRRRDMPQNRLAEALTLPALEQALSGGFFQLELADDTRLRRDLWDRCGDDTLRGLFLRRLRQEYDAADPRRQKEIEQAVRFGLAAMDNKEL